MLTKFGGNKMNIFQSYLNLNKPAVSFEVNQVRVSLKKGVF